MHVVVLSRGSAAHELEDPENPSRQFLTALVFVSVLIAAIFAGDRLIDEADGTSNTYMVCALLKHRTFFVDAYRAAHNWLRAKQIGDHWVSKYGIGAPLLSVPFFIGARGLGHPRAHWKAIRKRGRLAAGSMVILFALLVYLASLSLRIESIPAAVLSASLVLGTTLWSSASQDLWQYAFVAVPFASILLLLVRAEGAVSATVALGIGACLGLTFLCRPFALVAGVSIAAGAFTSLRRALAAALGALPFVGLQAWYDLTHLKGLVASGYGDEATMFTSSLFVGLPGALISPSRGLFVYSPYLLLAPVAIIMTWRSGTPARRWPLLWIVVGVFLHTAMVAKWHAWAGGWSYGPRLMTEATVLLGFALLLTYETWHHSKIFVGTLGILVALSVGIHSLQVFWPNDLWNIRRTQNLESAAFDWTDTQIGTHWEVALQALRTE